MKDFIYFDTDYINSYIAQSHDGIPTTTNRESETIHEINKLEHRNIGINKNLGLNLACVKSSLGKDSDFMDKTVIDTDSVKEAISKIFYDNSYNLLIKDIFEQRLFTTVLTPELGKFVHIIGKFHLIDLDIFSDELFDFMEYYSKINKNKYDTEIKALKALLKGKPTNPMINKQISDIEDKIKGNQFQKKDIMPALNLLKKIIPSSIILKYDKFVIFTEKKYFRQSSESILLKYSDNLHLVGRITKKGIPFDTQKDNPMEEKENLEDKSKLDSLLAVYETMSYYLVDLLNSLGLDINENSYFVTPIAIYFM